MMIKPISFLSLSSMIFSALFSSTAGAVALSNSIVFVENGVDDEYFVTPRSLDPALLAQINFLVIQQKTKKV